MSSVPLRLEHCLFEPGRPQGIQPGGPAEGVSAGHDSPTLHISIHHWPEMSSHTPTLQPSPLSHAVPVRVPTQLTHENNSARRTPDCLNFPFYNNALYFLLLLCQLSPLLLILLLISLLLVLQVFLCLLVVIVTCGSYFSVWHFIYFFLKEGARFQGYLKIVFLLFSFLASSVLHPVKWWGCSNITKAPFVIM